MHRCASCVISVGDAQKYRQVRVESSKVLAALAEEQAWDGTEPAFQLLVLPVKSEEQLPVYENRPEYLSPAHCRLCLAEFEGQGAAVVDGVADESVVEGARANVGASVVAGALGGREARPSAGECADGVNAEAFANGSGAPEEDFEASTLLKLHLRVEHDMSFEEYRRDVLGRVVTEWPQSVTAQVLRTRLAAFKQELCDANFACAPLLRVLGRRENPN